MVRFRELVVTSVLFYYYTFYVSSAKVSRQVCVDRSGITYINPDYVTYANFTTVKWGRTGKQTGNLIGHIKHAWGDNITISMTFYEFLNNEYRKTFIDLKFKLCKLIREEPWYGSQLAEVGLAKLPCPLPAGDYALVNMTGLTFPDAFPMKKGKVAFEAHLTSNHTLIGSLEQYFEVKDVVVKRKN